MKWRVWAHMDEWFLLALFSVWPPLLHVGCWLSFHKSRQLSASDSGGIINVVHSFDSGHIWLIISVTYLVVDIIFSNSLWILSVSCNHRSFAFFRIRLWHCSRLFYLFPRLRHGASVTSVLATGYDEWPTVNVRRRPFCRPCIFAFEWQTGALIYRHKIYNFTMICFDVRNIGYWFRKW